MNVEGIIINENYSMTSYAPLPRRFFILREVTRMTQFRDRNFPWLSFRRSSKIDEFFGRISGIRCADISAIKEKVEKKKKENIVESFCVQRRERDATLYFFFLSILRNL